MNGLWSFSGSLPLTDFVLLNLVTYMTTQNPWESVTPLPFSAHRYAVGFFSSHLSPLYDKRGGAWCRGGGRQAEPSWPACGGVCLLVYIQARSYALTSDTHQVGFHFHFLKNAVLFKPWRSFERCCSSQTGSLQGGGPLDVGSAKALKTFHINSLQTTFSHDARCCSSPASSSLLCGFKHQLVLLHPGRI